MREHSIRRSLIKRTVIALTVIGVSGAMAAYVLGYRYANLAYDRALLDDVETLADQVSMRDGKLEVNLPPAAQKWLLANEGERVIWQVIDLRTGEVIDGNGSLGNWSVEEVNGADPHFRNAMVGNAQFRVAYLRKVVDPADHPALIEIGETLGKRLRMASNILIATLAIMLAMIAASAALIWSGVLKSLAPLHELEMEAAKRSSTNLTALQPELAPEEVRGLIHSINGMMERLTLSIETQRRFTANAAHQLRTPIAGLKLQAQIVLRGALDPETRAHLLEIEREAARSSHLIDQLLTLSKAESGELMLVRKPVDLVKLARTVIERSLPQASAKDIDLGFEGPVESVFVEGNEVLLVEMLNNLVDNAIRYAGKGGKVTLQAGRGSGSATVSVADNGPGVSAHDRDKLFVRLYRSDASRQIEGAGLGLAIVKEIADRHHARVTVETAVGKGCRFDVHFSDGMDGHLEKRSPQD